MTGSSALSPDDQPFSSENSCTAYLLGRSSPVLKFERYKRAMRACEPYGEFLSFENSTQWLSCYEKDASLLHAMLPLLVFRPNSTAGVAHFLRVCCELNIPVAVRCGGTGLSGGCVPSKGGALLLTGHLNQIKEYRPELGTLFAEPGVTPSCLNRLAECDGWEFPLEMATDAVAGIAGCLSCRSRGYGQQHESIYHLVEKVVLVDGCGDLLEVPAPFVCGAEGLWGVIVGMFIRLKKKGKRRLGFITDASWPAVSASLGAFRSMGCLTRLFWSQGQFFFGLEGEEWRMGASVDFLYKCLPGLKPSICPFERDIKALIPTRRTFASFCSVFQSSQLESALLRSLTLADHLGLQLLSQADLLAGSLHLVLQSADASCVFAEKLEHFFSDWASYLDALGGALASCHGVGMQMRPYMPPFWSEESQGFLKKLKAVFDPQELFSREHFFPPYGKSLERGKT